MHTDEQISMYITETPPEARTESARGIVEAVAGKHLAILAVMAEAKKPIKIESPNELPGNTLLHMYQFGTEDELMKFKYDGPQAWKFKSGIIAAWYLFVPVAEAG